MSPPAARKYMLQGNITLKPVNGSQKEAQEKAIKIWQELADDVTETEQGRVKLDLYLNEETGEFCLLEEFASEAVFAEWRVKPSYVTVNKKVMEEGLLDNVNIKFFKHILSSDSQRL